MRVITNKEYQTIITTLREGYMNKRINTQVPDILVLEANLGLRVGDVLRLTKDNFIKVGEGYILRIIEQKTSKVKEFTVPQKVMEFIDTIELPFTVSARTVRKTIQDVCDYLGYKDIGSHSFRKLFATNLYELNNNIELVREALNHSDIAITQRYIGVDKREVSAAVEQIVNIL